MYFELKLLNSGSYADSHMTKLNVFTHYLMYIQVANLDKTFNLAVNSCVLKTMSNGSLEEGKAKY